MLGAVVTGASQLFAASVTTTEPGMVESLLKNQTDVTTLTVAGPVDASDLYFMGLDLKSLTMLDLSGATVVAYNGPRLFGKTVYPEATIPQGAFAGSPVTDIVFPTQEGLKIGDVAFMGSALAAVTFPANVVSVGMGAFAACDALAYVQLPSCEMGSAVFENCMGLVTASVTGRTTLPDATFRACTSLTSVEGADGLTSIGASAFEGDRSLTGFAFGPKLTYVGKSAFASTGLTGIDLNRSKGLNNIGEQVFAQTDAISVALHDDIESIDHSAFFDNAGLTAIELPANLSTLGGMALVGTPLDEIALPSGLEEIGDYALKGQNKIATLKLPEALVYIGDYGMADMTGLQSIDAAALPEIPELGENVWDGVEQDKVTLQVANDSPMFEDAPQWQNFIVERPTGVDDITGDVAGQPDVRGRFVGTELQIESDGPYIDTVRLYDTAGRLVLMTQPDAPAAYIETADVPGRVFIVSIALENNSNATLKLARR